MMEDPVRKMKEALFSAIREVEAGRLEPSTLTYDVGPATEDKCAKITIEFYDREENEEPKTENEQEQLMEILAEFVPLMEAIEKIVCQMRVFEFNFGDNLNGKIHRARSMLKRLEGEG